ncbi:MAG: hypothetical protein ABI443_11100 [Chthoniobacterales bacterium]
MLFEAKTGEIFRGPGLGGPQFYGARDVGIGLDYFWPLEPITLVDNIPFLITHGYAIAGRPAEKSSVYLSYCIEKMQWRKSSYHPVTKKEMEIAFTKLLQCDYFKKYPLYEFEMQDLREQMR